MYENCLPKSPDSIIYLRNILKSEFLGEFVKLGVFWSLRIKSSKYVL